MVPVVDARRILKKKFKPLGKSFIDLDVGVYSELGEERVSPRSGKIYYKPVVSQSLKLVKGMVFDSVELAYGFYVSHAHASGYSVRKNSAYTNHGLLKLKYYVCSKEGFESGCEYSTLDDANNEEHNHSFVHKDDIQFLTSARRVDYIKESAIQALSQVYLGPVRAFNILKSLYGGYEQVGATKNDFKNFKTRQSEYISEYDADMVIKRLEKKKKHCPNFSFDYTIKEDGTLGGLLWADDYSNKSYLVFGDVVGFDATYRSNKYDMVFIPFTGIDNHNRNITLGAALLGSETADSYSWEKVTAMKRVIQDVFPNSRHRLFMWHIWEKVTSKVGPATPNVAEFKEKLVEIVWTDSITTDEFEEKWPSILSDYGLSDHEWLADLYKIRKGWIPTDYVKDYMSKADEAQVVAPPPSRRDILAEMTGMREPCSVTIRNPVRTRTKGCGSHKRFKSAREIAISKPRDKQRGCGFCKGVGHNIRTCKLYLQSIKEK
ncbi:protein FAR1-RELATED SEQUENCE 5-like [Bidens hawaiensis]|uniref:protein FAR1-RELATED SEQUENCE 5-like n=1 Tax=Bidens hawaiensis TaxID=980011 RepID=UPI0040493BF0